MGGTETEGTEWGRVLGAELQPEELLLEAVEAPWKEERDEVSSGEEVEACSPLQPGGLAPKRMRDGSNWWAGWQRQATAEEGRATGGSWREEARQLQVEPARVQCRPMQCSTGGWQLHSEGSADTGGAVHRDLLAGKFGWELIFAGGE